MSRTYTEAVSGAILARTPVWNIAWEVALAKGETRHVTVDGFEFVLQADSRQTPTLNRGRVVSEDRVGRLYLPGWTDPADPTVWTYIYVSTSLTQPFSEGLGAPKLVSRTEFDESVPHYYSKEGAIGDAWLGNVHVLAIGDQSENVLISEFGRKGGNSLMWLSLLITLLSFIASKASGSSTKKALGHALVAGAATHLVTTQTEWGQDLSRSFDNFIGVSNEDETTVRPTPETEDVVVGRDGDGNDIIETRPIFKPVGGNSNGSITGSLVDVWNGMSPAGKALTGGAAVYTASSFLKKYGLWILGGVGAYLLLKD